MTRLVAYVDSLSMTSLVLSYAALVIGVLFCLFFLMLALDRHAATWKQDQWGRKWDERQSKPVKTWRL